MVRVRFAPSPTGYLHVGGLRTALYNELFARHNKGTVVLRIEDTDQTRYVEGAVENILKTLAWAGIEIDEGPRLNEDGSLTEVGDKGPYFQSKRLELYRKYAEELLASDKAYRCFCTAERLTEMRERQRNAGLPVIYDRHCRKHLNAEEIEVAVAADKPYVIRLKIPTEGEAVVDDAVRGKVRFPIDTLDDQVLLKSDGFPTYHLANVVDDHLMGITHVIRGEEWLPSTPKHILMYRAFGWEPPAFAHLPLLLNPDRSKLSKRQGDVAVEDYRDKGYLSEALINFIALLGFNPKGDQEVYTKGELVEYFDLSKVNKGGAVFNTDKLDWLNREYIKRLTDDELAELAAPYFRDVPGMAGKETLIPRIVHLERTRASRLSEMAEGSEFYFATEANLNVGQLPWKKSTPEIAKDRLEGVRNFLSGLDQDSFDDKEKLQSSLLNLVQKKGWTNAETLWPTRFALTGKKASPGPAEVAWVLGKDKSLARIERAISLL